MSESRTRLTGLAVWASQSLYGSRADTSYSGVMQLFSLVGSLVGFIFPHGVHKIVRLWGRPGHIGANLAAWPTDFSRDITPIPCHSHNDYWRRVPLYSAIEAGCIGVEADIWLFQDELFVGHSVASLTPNRTLNSLYIYPLLDILSKQNPKDTLVPEGDHQIHGVFDTNPEQTLILLIDFKTAGAALWPHVQSALEPLRIQNYLTRANGTHVIRGPITVVGTGNTPFDLVDSDTSNPHRDIFFDSPLGDLYEAPGVEGLPLATSPPESTPIEGTKNEAQPTRSATNSEKRSDEEGQGKSGTISGNTNAYNTGNSYYASVSFTETIGLLWNGEFSADQLDKLRGQIRGAHKRGLKARYWDLPFWPINLRNHVWDVLVKEGVDLLNVDDLKGATKRNWDKHHGWWQRMESVSYDVNGGIDGFVGGPTGRSDF